MTGIERLRRLAGSQDMGNAWTAMLANELTDIADQIAREQDETVADSPHDALPPEDRDAVAWVREHGGLEVLRRMFQDADNRRVELCAALGVDPDMGWSDAMADMRLRFVPKVLDADGVEIREGDTVYLLPGDWCDDFPLLRCHEWDAMKVLDLSPNHDTGRIECETSPGSVVCYPYPSQLTHQRPVLDADRAEIRVGDRVWTKAGTGMVVTLVESDKRVVMDGARGGRFVYPAYQLTHRAPVLAADGRPLREGDTVYELDDDRPYTLKRFDGDHVYINAGGSPFDIWTFPNKLTHERPVADTWERLEEDARELKDDIGFHLGDYSPSDFKQLGDSIQDRVMALVRRAKALAERGA